MKRKYVTPKAYNRRYAKKLQRKLAPKKDRMEADRKQHHKSKVRHRVKVHYEQ